MSNGPAAGLAVLGVAGPPADTAVGGDSLGAVRSHSRRQLLLGGVVAAGFSLVSGRQVAGQPATKISRIGFLAVGSREGYRALLIEGLLQGLRERGDIEGQNIVIEYRFSEDRNDRLPALAAELVALKVQLIVASGTLASLRRSKPPARSRSSWGPSPPVRSRPVLSPAWRALAATSRE